MKIRVFLVFTLLSFLLVPPFISPASTMNIRNTEPDYWPTTDWQTATPESQGMDSSWFHHMEAYIESTFPTVNPLRSILVIRHGYLVYENYFGIPENVNQTNNIYSCTKSVTSSLIGIAESLGFLDITDDLVDFFSDLTITNLDSRKESITVEHLLTMTSGLPWDEWTYPYGSTQNDWNRMTSSPNWVQFVLDRPMDYAPGEQWVYNTGGSHLLSAILTRASNTSTLTFAETYLFSPLGITEFAWTGDPQHIANGGSSLHLRPRDMAKFGFLYLHNGTWAEQQILPASWVATSSTSHVTIDSFTEYGYQWWIHPTINAYAAHGYQNQHIYVFPNQDMVVVFTARSTNLNVMPLLEEFILPATLVTPNLYYLIIGLAIASPLIVLVILSVLLFRRNRDKS